MRGAIAALRAHLAADVGLEGLLLLVGTLLLAVGSSYLSPAGPWLVVGIVALVLGLALAIPVRRAG